MTRNEKTFRFLGNVSISPRDAGRVDDKDLDEVSGCVASRINPGVLWIHNDGDADSISAIRTNGETVVRLELPVPTDDVVGRESALVINDAVIFGISMTITADTLSEA